MSEDERRLSDEIRDAKAKLYYLLLLSSETKVYNPTKSDLKLIKRLSKDEQIQEPFKPMPEKATEPMYKDLLELKKIHIRLIDSIHQDDEFESFNQRKYRIESLAHELHKTAEKLITKPKTNGDEPK